MTLRRTPGAPRGERSLDPETFANVGAKPHVPHFYDDPTVVNAEGDLWTWDATNVWFRVQGMLAALGARLGTWKVPYTNASTTVGVALGVARTIFMANGVAAAPTFTVVPEIDEDVYYSFYQDFVVPVTTTAPDGWTRFVGGDGTSQSYGAQPSGLWQCETAAGAGTGTGSIYLGGSGTAPLQVQYNPTVVVRFDHRSTHAASELYWAGMMEASTFGTNSSTEPNDFIGFRYDGALKAVTRDDGVETTTTLTGLVTGAFTLLKAVVSGGATVTFSVDNVVVATHTTNLPDATATLTAGFKHQGDGGGGLVDFIYGWQARAATA